MKETPTVIRKKICISNNAIKLYKQPKTKQKKEHIRLVIVFIGENVLAKIVDEFYISIKIYSYFSFVFSVVTKKVELLKIPKMM